MRVTRIEQRHVFAVNCYVVAVDGGHVLIDTGVRQRRRALEAELTRAGCKPGGLRLIVLTHAHADHAGNCAYLRARYRAPLAMHAGDAGKAARGDMFWTPGRPPAAVRAAKVATAALGLARFDAFTPDVLLEDGQDLREYGLAATALHLPGHTAGSVAVLCAGGELFCGDLLTNTRRPEVNRLVDDAALLERSVARLDGLGVGTVYPGHGVPFAFDAMRRGEAARRAREQGRVGSTGGDEATTDSGRALRREARD